jgi:hypothetical protein
VARVFEAYAATQEILMRRHSQRAGAGATHRVDPAGVGRGSERVPKTGVQIRDIGRTFERPKTARSHTRHRPAIRRRGMR